MPGDALEALRDLVVDDPILRRRLLDAPGRPEFAATVVAIARERGLDLDGDEVLGALRAERRRQSQRWV